MNAQHSDHMPASAPAGDWIGHPDEAREMALEFRRGRMIDMDLLRGFLFRQRIVIIATIALALLGGLIVTLVTTPVYRAEATTYVEPDGNTIVEGQDLAPRVASNQVYQYLETLGEVIESRKMAGTVVDALKLYDRPEFFGENIDKSRPEGITDEQWASQKRELATALVQANVSAEIPVNNRIIAIRYSDGNPAMAAMIANAYARNFAVSDNARRLEANAYALEYLSGQISQTRAKLQDAELAANAYARSNRIISSSTGQANSVPFGNDNSPTITAANLASVNAGYTETRANRIALEQRWLAIKDVPAGQISEVQQSQVLQELSAERTRVAAELADLRERYDESFPQVAELAAKRAELDRQIARTGADIKSALENEFRIASRQERALAGELERISQESLAEQDRKVRFGMLDREAGALRLQLAALLDRYNDIAAAENVQAGSITLLDSAVIPAAPASPSLMRNLLIALVLGSGLALTLAILREVLDDRLRSLEDVEAKFGVPLIGHTPFIDGTRIEEEISKPYGALLESYSSIVSTLDYILPREGQVLQFTSSQASEGKTTTAKVVAERYAQLGRKTLLIDADLRRPALAAEFGHERPDCGLTEVLLGHCDLQAALLPGTPENLDVLAVGKVPPNPVDLLSSDALGAFIAQLRPHYSRIILDTSPVMGIADAPLLARHADGTVFIVEANRVHFGQARASLRRLQAVGARVCGIVLTKYRALEAGQSYGYEYRYYSYSAEQ